MNAVVDNTALANSQAEEIEIQPEVSITSPTDTPSQNRGFLGALAVPRVRNTMLGAVIAGVAGWAVLSPLVFAQSVEAILNAPVSNVRTPIDGVVGLENIKIGAPVTQGQSVATISNAWVNTQLLVSIEMELGLVNSTIVETEASIESLQTLHAHIAAQWDAYRAQRNAFLTAQVGEVEAEVLAAQAGLTASEAHLSRTETLYQRGISSSALLETALLEHAKASTALTALQERQERLLAERHASQNGVFVGQYFNDSPYTLQRLNAVEQQLAELRPTLQAALQRRAALINTKSEENARLSRLREARLVSTVDGMLWKREVHEGEYAQAGQTIASFVDCTALLVTATVTERTFNKLMIGQSATLKLTRSGEEYEGRVNQLLGPNTRVSGLGFAIAPRVDGRDEFRVVVGAPTMSDALSPGCDIGRTGTVWF